MKSVALFHQRWPHSTRDSEAQSAHDRLHAPYRGLMIKVCNITETVAKEIEQERYPPTPVASQLTATSVEEMPISSHLFSIVAGGKKQLFQPPQARVWYIYIWPKGSWKSRVHHFFAVSSPRDTELEHTRITARDLCRGWENFGCLEHGSPRLEK